MSEIRKAVLFTVTALSRGLIAGVANAEEPRFCEQDANPKELAEFLFAPDESSPGDSNSRSWVVKDKPTSNVAALKILFEFDSAKIQSKSLRDIELLALALNTEMAGDRAIMIEGHTDAVGAEVYNQELSVRRAASVKDYLISIYRIEPERLFVAGFGETELLEPDNPNAAINRRVQVRPFDSGN